MPISADSTRWTSASWGSSLTRAAAAIHPAVQPPRTTTRCLSEFPLIGPTLKQGPEERHAPPAPRRNRRCLEVEADAAGEDLLFEAEEARIFRAGGTGSRRAEVLPERVVEHVRPVEE